MFWLAIKLLVSNDKLATMHSKFQISRNVTCLKNHGLFSSGGSNLISRFETQHYDVPPPSWSNRRILSRKIGRWKTLHDSVLIFPRVPVADPREGVARDTRSSLGPVPYTCSFGQNFY